MPIETICRGCARKLRVADEHAGKQARCPHCKTVYTVPTETPPSPRASDASPADPAADRWLVRLPDGSQYGPVTKKELDAWVAEGRVVAQAQIKQDGAAAWQPAGEVFPSLAETAYTVESFPNKGAPAGSAASSAPGPNPYAAPSTLGPAAAGRRFFKPHRGGTILTLGILGILCCGILGVLAWIMGQSDLSEINAGRMDPAGKGLTQVGMILGIVATVLLVLSVAANALQMAVFNIDF